MLKRLFAISCFVTLVATGLWAGQTEPPAAAPSDPVATQTSPVAELEAAPVVTSDPAFVPEVEFGGELVATLQAFVYCKNIGGACTSSSQCGNLGTCVNNVCECECNYGAFCNPANPNCGYAGFCNEFNHRCACF